MKNNLAVKNTSEYKVISTEETFRLLETSADGLTNSEVQRRLQIFGFNEVTEKRRNTIIEFLLRYWGPMPWLLELAIVLSIVLNHYLEAGIIFALLDDKYRHRPGTVARLPESAGRPQEAVGN